jgi:hypothetical protein
VSLNVDPEPEAGGQTPTKVRRPAFRLPAVAFVVVYCVLMLCVPSQLILKPLGAAGTPANLWGLAALLWWILATLGGQNPGRLSPLRLATGALALTVLASYAAGMTHGWYAPPDVRQATDELWSMFPFPLSELTEKMKSAADRGLLSFASWTGILLLTADGLRSWRDLELLATWLSWLGAVVASLGIIQFFTGVDIAGFFQIPGLVANAEFGAVDSRSVLNRVAATARHPIEFGVLMGSIFPLALHHSIYSRRSKAVWIPTVLIGTAIPMSVSRSAIITLGIAMLVMFIGWPWAWRRRALFIAPLAVVTLRVLVPGLVGTIISLFRWIFADTSVTGRTDDYTVVFALYSDHMFLGRGLATFLPRYYRILDNQMFGLLIEIGLIGFVVALVFLAVSYFSARGARRRARDERARHLSLALSAAIAGVVTSYFTFDALGYPMTAGITFLLAGMAGAAWRTACREADDAAQLEAQ